MENMGEEEGKNTYQLGGGEKREWTPAEAADWFAEKYLPDLREVSVRFPEEWLYSGCSIQTPDLPVGQLEKQMCETVELGEKNKVGSFMANVTGDNAEHEMYKYLTRTPKTSRTALLQNYTVKQFRLFTGTNKQNQIEDSQEFDFIYVFSDHKYIHVEVKTGTRGGGGFIEQLEKGEKFYTEVLGVLAAAGLNMINWEFIPVAAFPNAKNQSEVRGHQAFKAKYRNSFILTQHEIKKPESLEDLLLPRGQIFQIDKTYLALVKLFMASAHCSKSVGSLSLTPSDPVKETKGKLVGSNTSDLGVGVSEDPGPSSSTVPLFSSLKGKPVGSQESILFWNKEQAQFLFQDNPRCIIKGDYGSGIKIMIKYV